MIPKLSALKAAYVDQIYNIDTALKRDEPVFLFLIGSPGAGKSSGHTEAKSAGLIPDNYATLNVDLLLESLIPFRASSSMAHLLKHIPETKEFVKFSTIPAYGSKKEDVGMFKWYDDSKKHFKDLADKSLNQIRDVYELLSKKNATAKLLDIHEKAIQRAIKKKINIVLETTLSLKGTRVKKVDEIMKMLEKTPYKVVFYHVYGKPDEVASRLRVRQEYEMPHDDFPYYRYVPANVEAVKEYMKSNKEAFDALKTQYTHATFGEFENIAKNMPKFPELDAGKQLETLIRVYGQTRKSKKKTKRSTKKST